MDRNRWWKVLGIAGVAGVVATGALVARDERARRAYTPDEVRDRLRERHDGATSASSPSPAAPSSRERV